MCPKSLCMRYFFVDMLAHYIKNALFVECVSTSTKKCSAYTDPFFVDVLAHYIKTYIICGMRQCIYKKSSAYTSFQDAFQINLVTKTSNRHPKPETKTIQNAPLLKKDIGLNRNRTDVIRSSV